VFDEVTKHEGGRNAARKAGYVVGSTAFQILLVVAIITASAAIKAKVTEEAPVDVKFVRQAAPPPPPPPPPAPVARRPPQEKKSDTPRPPPPPPQALLQPKDVQEEMKTNPNEPKEPEYDYGATASGEGVVGGVVGAPTGGIEDAPAYATAGYVKPAEVERGCVAQSTRIPTDLKGFVTGTPITVKFAVRADGSTSQFQVMTPGVPDRIAAAVFQAVQSCRFKPGTDPRGKPTPIWVILPLRFRAD
jgi:protein TonB